MLYFNRGASCGANHNHKLEKDRPMPVYVKFLQNRVALIVFTLAFICVNRAAFAEDMSMDAIHAEFQQATGKTWESATSEEKRDFVGAHIKTAEQTLQENRKKTVALEDKTSNLRRVASVEVRKEFIKEHEKDWDEATAEEQEAFLKEYKAKKKEKAQLEQQKMAEEQALQQRMEQQKQSEIWAAQAKKQAEELKRIEEERQLQEKRDAEKRKLEEQFRKFQETRQRMIERRRQGN